MAKQKVSRVRLVINGIGCVFIAMICLPVGLPGLIGLLSGSAHLGRDPDSGDKLLAIQMLCVIVGTITLISLFRTAKAWRESTKD